MNMNSDLKQLVMAVSLGCMGASPAFAGTNSLAVSATQQTSTCTGVVVDDLGETVIGASVIIKGTSNGTVTDLDGKFSLSGVKNGDIIVISYIGYDSQEIKYDGQPLQVKLNESKQTLAEVVVTGYGGQQKRGTLTTAIAKMDNRVLETAAVSNAGSALQGSVTGLRVTQTTGQPGSEPTITLRGGASINGGSDGALIVVDGIIRESLGDINPADIESIQVLKDAASTAIYGARANGGVILVQTKGGKSGKATVNYKGKLGMNFARLGYDMLDAHDYIYYNRLGYQRYANVSGANNLENQTGYGTNSNLCDVKFLDDTNKNLLSKGWLQMKDPVTGKDLIYKDYNGELDDASFRDVSLTQDHYVSVAGGSDRGTFFTSLGYYDEDGMVRGTGYQRFNGSVNASYKVLPILNVKAGATYSWAKKPKLWIGEYEFFYRTRSQRPTWNPYLEDGSPAPGWSTSDGNPDYYRPRLTRENCTRKSTYNLGWDLDIIPKKLTWSANASLYHYDYQNEKFDKSFQPQTSNVPNNVRTAVAEISRFSNVQINTTLNYKDTFAENHNVDAMIGGEYFDHNTFDFSAETQNSPTDDIPTLNAGATRSKTYSYKSRYRIESLFGRINYDYQQKYLLSFTARYDGISKLKDNRWGFFPGVSAGWNVTQEEWWKNSKISNIITNIKPRISYGVNGNVNGIGDFAIYGVYTQIGAKTYNGQTAYYNSTLLNTGLRWEQSRSLEIGLDLGFLNNRLAFILDYYNRTTDDLLTNLNLPAYTGFMSMKTNLGKLRNTGFEMEIRANILNNPKGFKWDISANLTSVANKILQLPNSDKPNNQLDGYEVADGTKKDANGKQITKWIGGYAEGGKLGDIVGYKQQHIFKNWEDVKAHANMRIDEVAKLYGPGLANEINPATGKTYATSAGWKPIEPGDVCWEDVNQDGTINSLDKSVLGNIFPNVTGGFSTTLTYKNVSLYARFDYALGHTIYNHLKARSMGQYQGQFNNITLVKDMWSEDNPNSDYPAYSYSDQLNKKNLSRESDGADIDGHSSRMYEKGDYLALREITLNWNIPTKWLTHIGISKASAYITGQNLFYITGYGGASPEPKLDSYYKGVDLGRYPTPLTLLFGLNVTF